MKGPQLAILLILLIVLFAYVFMGEIMSFYYANNYPMLAGVGVYLVSLLSIAAYLNKCQCNKTVTEAFAQTLNPTA